MKADTVRIYSKHVKHLCEGIFLGIKTYEPSEHLFEQYSAIFQRMFARKILFNK